jgi:hypothetical protein
MIDAQLSTIEYLEQTHDLQVVSLSVTGCIAWVSLLV